MDEFKDEVLFHVGERVKVRIAPDIIPAHEIGCATGVVRNIYTKFMLTPKMRKFTYEVWLDGPYHAYVGGAAVKVLQNQLEKI